MDRHEQADEKIEKIDMPEDLRANRQYQRHFHYRTTLGQFGFDRNKISLSPHIALSAAEMVLHMHLPTEMPESHPALFFPV